MNVSNDPQELARRFNDAEALWRRYRQKRDLCRLRSLPGLLPDEVLDRLDWLEAERECRETRCVGRPTS